MSTPNDSAKTFHTTNPANGETIAVYDYFTPDEIERRLQRVWSGHQRWSARAMDERAARLAAFAVKLEGSKEELARLMALEMGKPLKDGRAEVEKCVKTCEFVAQTTEEWPRNRDIEVDGRKARVLAKPVGPILTVMPWNFPLWQLVRVLAPALLNGNSILLRHSDQVAGSAELIETLLADHEDILVNVRVPHERVESLLADSRVRAATLTGSVAAGSAVAALAGKYLKKSVLELGGSDPYLVFADADVEAAAVACAKSRLINNGQSCIAAKRFFVEKPVLGKFLEAFTAALGKPVIGAPTSDATDLGPLAHARFVEGLERQVTAAYEDGMSLHWSRAHGQTRGAYADIQVLLGTGQERSFYEEEFFGPVALVASFEKEAQALQMANSAIYGLGAAVFTKDAEKARRVSEKLECGIVSWNDFVRSDARFPFGGVKFSGFGRELSREGLLEFTQAQTVFA